MKIFTAAQIRKADAYTILNEPISSVDLMERAATQIFDWLVQQFNSNQTVSVFCGVGNNGGDGLVIARLLLDKGYHVTVYEVQFSSKYSKDYIVNKSRLAAMNVPIIELCSEKDFNLIHPTDVVIDAIFGSGLSKPVHEWLANLIGYLNSLPSQKVAVDMASGLFSENNDVNNGIAFEPDHTLCFEFPKLAFFLPANHKNVGVWEVLPIGLSKAFIEAEETPYCMVQHDLIQSIHQKGNKFDHKGIFGHAALIGGSYGKMGAVVLSAKAAIKSGAGLVSVQVPSCGVDIMQVSVPEIMVLPDQGNQRVATVLDYAKYSAIGVGPGLGTHAETRLFLTELIHSKPERLVLDADALNILAAHPELLPLLPKNTIITPHIGEWIRLQGNKPQNDFERLEAAQLMAKKYHLIIVLKGANTAIISPLGDVFFNSTGNPGMATAGSGDVLTGIITGLLAQKYLPLEAAILGVYIHGKSGDLARAQESRESLIASSIISNLGKAFRSISE